MTAHRSVAATPSQPRPMLPFAQTMPNVGGGTVVMRSTCAYLSHPALASSPAHNNGTGLIGYRHHLLGLVRKKLVNRLLGAAVPGQARVVMHDQESAGHQARVEIS